MLYVTGETAPSTRKEKEGTGKRDPGNRTQRKRPATPSKSQRKLNPLRDLLPMQRVSHLRRNEAPQFHATQDSDTLPFCPPKVQSQGTISLSLHTVKFADREIQIIHSGLSYVAAGGAKSRMDVLYSPTGMPLA